MNRGLPFSTVLLVPIFTLAWITASPAFALERELFGVSLGENYERARSMLTVKYGEPLRSSAAPARFDAFAVGREGHGTLIISSTEDLAGFVTAVQLSAKEPIDGFRFLAGIEFGQTADSLELSLPFATTRPSEDGYTLHDYEDRNFSIESREGRVASIRITLEGSITVHGPDSLWVFSEAEAGLLVSTHKVSGDGPTTEEQLRALATDPLLQHCDFRYPIDVINGSPLVPVHVGAPVAGDLRAGSAYFLLDTGWSTMGISRQRCERTRGCQLVTEPENSAGSAFSGPVAIGFGGKQVFVVNALNHFDGAVREILETATGRDVEGVIGGSILLARPMFLNFKHGYICFPRESVSAVAKKLGLHSVAAEYDAGRVWVDFEVNGTTLKDYFIDSGATGTSILPEHAQKLGAKASGTGDHVTAKGLHEAKVYDGPFSVRFGGATVVVETLDEAPNPEWRKLGTDLIGGLILGLDASGELLFVGH